ncbi:hypothetical protein [Enterovirga aerilata]|uniref:Uncharacterized protein n=1 Tax=Enterovirga aerilata TaxID=2730920 RepID=A0A849IIT1_9HYPH|nr:hypothetical protein [Enterovirga sp. DB1703]NNM73853.1 hypothetical protein [Enterovirga sp. DB1703]
MRKNKAIHALAVWRSLHPDDIGAKELRSVRDTLAEGQLQLLDRRWPAAVRGEAFAAVGIGVERLHDRAGPQTASFDLAMTALVPAACGGNPAAALVLAHGLEALARANGDIRADALAQAWARRCPMVDAARPRRPR